MTDDATFAGAPHADPAQWDRLIESVGPDGVLVAIGRMMGPVVRARCQAEDVWQETLIAAWRDREQHRWTGVKDYRSWLLTIARNRVTDIARRASAEKRGGETPAVGFGDLAPPADGSVTDLFPAGSVTPSRIASHRERAVLMQQALESLPEEFEAVLRLHLFEERPMENVVAELGIGLSAGWYRLRRGTALYVAALEALRSGSAGA
ncbi:MAG: RNA polymerase sigma factor [Planctomycetes bacterium]|nr:RNA polymerase sigma factor [Planctomycetota bacterium]